MVRPFSIDHPIRVKPADAADLIDVFTAYAGERPIIVPQGRYRVDEALVVQPNTIVQGEGRYYDSQGQVTLDADPVVGTVIELDFDDNDGAVFDATAQECRGCVFRDFYLYGKGEGTGYHYASGFKGLFKSSLWENVGVGIFRQAGWWLGGSGGSDLYDNMLLGCFGYWMGNNATSEESAIVIDTGVSDVKVIGGTFSNSKFANFEVLSTGGGNHRLLGTTLQLARYGAYIHGNTANFDQCSIDQNDYDGILFTDLDGSGGSSSVIGCKLRKSSQATNDTYFHIRLDDYVNTRILGGYFRHGGGANKAKACIGWDNTTREPVYVATGIDAKAGANTLTYLGWDIVGGHTERQTDSIEEFIT
jgi:hypothetical protein